MNRNYAYGCSSLAKISTVSKPLQAICHEAMKIANSRKLHCPDFGISDGLRTAEEQFKLFVKGRKSTGDDYIVIGKVVTNCDGYEKLSIHQAAEAIDFFPLKNGKADYSHEACALVATCFFEAASNLGVEITWGGGYSSFSDAPHIELKQKSE